MKQWGVTLDTIDKAASENMKEELVSMHLYEKETITGEEFMAILERK